MVRSSTLRVGFFVALLTVFAYLLVLIVRPFLTALLAALLLAVLLAPAQRRLAPRAGEKVAAFGLVTLSLTAVAAIVAVLVVAAPSGLTDLSTVLQGFPAGNAAERRIENLLGVEVPLESIVESVPRRVAELLFGDVSMLVSATTDFFLGAVLFLFVLYYLLVDGDSLIDWVEDRLR
ncbi:AI-2E family transporter [Halosimplex aquaticum]